MLRTSGAQRNPYVDHFVAEPVACLCGATLFPKRVGVAFERDVAGERIRAVRAACCGRLYIVGEDRLYEVAEDGKGQILGGPDVAHDTSRPSVPFRRVSVPGDEIEPQPDFEVMP